MSGWLTGKEPRELAQHTLEKSIFCLCMCVLVLRVAISAPCATTNLCSAKLFPPIASAKLVLYWPLSAEAKWVCLELPVPQFPGVSEPELEGNESDQH